LLVGDAQAVLAGGADLVAMAVVFVGGGDVADCLVQSDGVVVLSEPFEFDDPHRAGSSLLIQLDGGSSAWGIVSPG
jgi:hypothetical protein